MATLHQVACRHAKLQVAPACCSHTARTQICRPPFRLRCPHRPVVPRTGSRRQITTRAGLLDFLTKPATPKNDARVKELVDDLLSAVRNTDGGAKASNQKRAEIAELVEELEGDCIRAPTRSPLFWGEYAVSYCSNPTAPGGPVLRSGPGRVLLTNQRLTQTLAPPNTLINSVSFKTAGLFPGSAQQEGRVRILDGNRYKVTLQSPTIKLGSGGGKGADAADEDGVERTFEVVYLDQRVRVVRFVPTEDQGEPSLFVFQRIAGADDGEAEEEDDQLQQYEDDEDEDESGEASKPGFSLGGFFAKPAPASVATIAERMARQADGTLRTQAGRPAPPQQQQRGAKAAAPSAGESKEAAQRAAIQRQLAELTAAAKEAQQDAKQAAKELRDFERASAGPVRQAEQARAVIARYASETEGAEQQAQMAADAEKKAAQQLREAIANLREVEKAAASRG